MGPLSGKTVLVTRPKGQAADLAHRLEELGARTCSVPAIQIVPLEDTSALDAELARLSDYDWLVLTSVNGVRAVQNRFQALGIPLDPLLRIKVAVIGPATDAALTSFRGRPADLCPDEFVSEAISAALGDVAGKRFLLARADLARKDLADNLVAAGANVVEVAAYHIRPSSEGNLPDRCPDYITVTSASSATAIVERLRDAGKDAWVPAAKWVAIGPIAAAALEKLGIGPAAVADAYTSDGLVAALLSDALKDNHV